MTGPMLCTEQPRSRLSRAPACTHVTVRWGGRCPTRGGLVLRIRLLAPSWFSGCRACVAQTGKLRLARTCQRNPGPWAATCTCGRRVCSQSGRDAARRQDGIPGRRGVQGGHRARRLAGWRDTCRQQHTRRRHSPAHSCPVKGHPPGDGPPWGSWAYRARRRLPASPGICPPTSSCHLCALQTLSQRPRELSTASHDHLPSPITPQRNLGTQTQICPSAVVPFPTPAEKGPLPPLPRWLQWRCPVSQDMPAGLHQAQAPTHPWL